MVEFDSEMVVRFQDMRSPISYFSRVYGFNGFLNYYKKGQKTEAVVTYLREGKAMDELRKAIRAKGYDFVDRKAGISIEVGEECYVCEMIDSLLSVKNALIEIPAFLSTKSYPSIEECRFLSFCVHCLSFPKVCDHCLGLLSLLVIVQETVEPVNP